MLSKRHRRLSKSIFAVPLRQGENPWQAAVLVPRAGELEKYKYIRGADWGLSLTNLTDMSRAVGLLECVTSAVWANFVFPQGIRIALGIKHGNPCGAAYGVVEEDVLRAMVEGSPKALFGGVVITNFSINAECAEILLHHKSPARRTLDIIVASHCSDEAAKLLQRKGDRGRILTNSRLGTLSPSALRRAPNRVHTRFGDITQESHLRTLKLSNPQITVTGKRIPKLEGDLAFAAAICRSSNSNTITLVKNGKLIGQSVGLGERALAAEQAVAIAKRNGHDPRGSVACSDSFFPFDDGLKILIKAGSKAIFSTTGSLRDDEVRKAVPKGVALYQLPDSEARMFFGHGG